MVTFLVTKAILKKRRHQESKPELNEKKNKIYNLEY